MDALTKMSNRITKRLLTLDIMKLEDIRTRLLNEANYHEGCIDNGVDTDSPDWVDHTYFMYMYQDMAKTIEKAMYRMEDIKDNYND